MPREPQFISILSAEAEAEADGRVVASPLQADVFLSFFFQTSVNMVKFRLPDWIGFTWPRWSQYLVSVLQSKPSPGAGCRHARLGMPPDGANRTSRFGGGISQYALEHVVGIPNGMQRGNM